MPFNLVSLRETLPLGQRVEEFCLDVRQGGSWHTVFNGLGIGNRRLARRWWWPSPWPARTS
jgi:hypothetical protein